MQHGKGMRPILVVYATRTGHTRHIAERVADRIRTLRHEAQIQDVRTEALPSLERYSAVILAASVHLGHHEREMVKFVRARRSELDRLPTVFLSVSLTEAAATDVHRPDDERLDAQRATRKVLEDFVLETGWRPGRSVPVAGALTDPAYGPLTRVLDAAHRPGRPGGARAPGGLHRLGGARAGGGRAGPRGGGAEHQAPTDRGTRPEERGRSRVLRSLAGRLPARRSSRVSRMRGDSPRDERARTPLAESSLHTIERGVEASPIGP